MGTDDVFVLVVSGQLMRKEVPSDRTKDVVEFSTKAPKERLASIRQAFSVRCFLRFILRYLFRLAMHISFGDARYHSAMPVLFYLPVLFHGARFVL